MITTMTCEETLACLKRLKVETRSLACFGCGHEHNCSIHGCVIIRYAVEYMKVLMQHYDHLSALADKNEAEIAACAKLLAESELARSELAQRLALAQAQLQEARAERERMYMSLVEKRDCDDCIRANDLVACEDADWNCDVCKDRQTCRCRDCGHQTNWKNWTWKGGGA